MLHEMSVGQLPFSSTLDEELWRQICEDEKNFDGRTPTSPPLQDLIQGLTKKDPIHRLGQSTKEIQVHRFFRHVDWARTARKETIPPV